MELPRFRYHPDPLKSGSVVPSSERCACCGEARGYVYDGPIYAEEEPGGRICPWCIASGAAHRKFEATLVDDVSVAGQIPEAARRELAERTPGFSSWQSERWEICCGDAAAFLGPMGAEEVRERGLDQEAIRFATEELKLGSEVAQKLIPALDRERGPTAYLFQCLHCRRYRVNLDFL